MNSKCADCVQEECRCDRLPMPAASPWREERETMTIIEDLRYAADNPDVFEHDYPSILRRIADRLERSGALVPVPDGEACCIREARNKEHNLYGRRLVEFFISPICHEAKEIVIQDALTHKKIATGTFDTIVQPVRLVPIAEAEL